MKPVTPWPAVLLASTLAGCIIAPPRPAVVAPAAVVPAGVVYVAPTYPAPAVGYVWAYHPRFGWGWHHPQYGWHRGWQ